ncbi:nitroreductase family protein [Obelidium mucronatum]|nr:nitroreductase family protein [Obelidium mucronatum]
MSSSTPFGQALLARRSHRAITANSPLSDTELENLVKFALIHAPSFFNSQSSRAVLLVKEDHIKYWQTAIENVKKVQSGDHLTGTIAKLSSYQKGYGTVLIWEDDAVIQTVSEKFPAAKPLFPEFQAHGSGILQFAIWTALAEAGLGASLQHYQAHTEKDTVVAYGLPESWRMIAQIPFGVVESGVVLPDKVVAPIESRFKSFGV